jgi:large subunit ribosomal protein L18
MDNQNKKNVIRRNKRALRVRKHLRGTAEKPRLCVVKTNKHLFAQLIDDNAGVTLGSVSTIAKEFRTTEFNKKNKASARQLGMRLAEIAKDKGVLKAVFDRGSSKYHGVLAELAEGARSSGLQF